MLADDEASESELVLATLDLLFPTAFLYQDRPSNAAAFALLRTLLHYAPSLVLPWLAKHLSSAAMQYARGQPEHGLSSIRTLASWTIAALGVSKDQGFAEWSDLVCKINEMVKSV